MAKILSTTLTDTYFTGTIEHISIKWMGEVIQVGNGTQSQRFVHCRVDDPPVQLFEGVDREIVWDTVTQQWAGEWAVVTSFTRVDSEEELEPGTFFIVSKSVRRAD